MRSRVERFFRYLKERTVVFHHKMSARNHVQGIKNLKLFLSLFTLREVSINAYLDTIVMEGIRVKYGGIGLEPGPAKLLEAQHTIREIQEHILGGGV
jgi:hypothetical protein